MPEITSGGRPAYVVNVEVYLHRGDRWLLIKRSEQEAHAPGILAGPGGKIEIDGVQPVVDIVELTARREVLEEVGVDIDGVPLAYVESCYFTTDDGDPVINVVVAGTLPEAAEPYAASGEEVAGLLWLTADEALTHPNCRLWTHRALAKAEEIRRRQM
jgi:8-oxo-dGTP pyrophosphatase MutT (NUDIX family)